MNLEIHKPELVQRVNAHIQNGRFHDVDEVLEKALDALEESVTAPPGGQAAKSEDRRMGADLRESTPIRTDGIVSSDQ